eukprot:scaffold3871_cov97-Isochrysis_galbana.AAC.6
MVLRGKGRGRTEIWWGGEGRVGGGGRARASRAVAADARCQLRCPRTNINLVDQDVMTIIRPCACAL